MDQVDICIDDYVSGESFDPSMLPRRVEPHSATSGELALAWKKQWQPGQELRIRFIDGDSGIHERVKNHATRWLQFANLVFHFGNHAEAEIRVSFKGNVYRSLVGTDAMRRPQAEPTMQLGGFTADMDDVLMRRTVLHEFGHAIGCIHEQASPAVAIPWNEAKVYEYYRRWQRWDDETIYRNVLLRYGRADATFTEHDPKSIMQYPVPKALTTGGFEIGWNNDLSPMDESFIARMYPR